MKVTATQLPEVLILEPRVFFDQRGCFFESWNAKTFAQTTGVDVNFVQDNQSVSHRGVLRGFHYQLVRPQGKLVRVVDGTVLDVAVDLRRSSTRFGRWAAVELSADNRRQAWVPAGFGHAFLVKSESATVVYKATDYWFAEHERSLRWDDEQVGVDWGEGVAPVLAGKDAAAPRLAEAEVYP